MSPTCEGGSEPFAIVLHDTAQPIALSFRPNYNILYLHTFNFHFSLSLYFHFRKCRKTFFRFKRFSLIYRDVTLSICKFAATRYVYVSTNTLVNAYVATILVRLASLKKEFIIDLSAFCRQNLEISRTSTLVSSADTISATYIRLLLLNATQIVKPARLS